MDIEVGISRYHFPYQRRRAPPASSTPISLSCGTVGKPLAVLSYLVRTLPVSKTPLAEAMHEEKHETQEHEASAARDEGCPHVCTRETYLNPIVDARISPALKMHE